MLIDEWKSYLRDCIHRDAGSVQVVETRRAFYGGAMSMLALLENTPDDESSAEEYTIALKRELAKFYEDFKQGMA